MIMGTAVPANYSFLLNSIRSVMGEAQDAMRRQVVVTYWTIGQQMNHYLDRTPLNRSERGALFRQLSRDLDVEYQTLHQAVRFQQAYPTLDRSLPLSWTHYRRLAYIDDARRRRNWERRIVKEGLSADEMAAALKAESAPEQTRRLDDPARGRLYHYRLMMRSRMVNGPNVLRVDCGFANYIEAPSCDTALSSKKVYCSYQEGGAYRLRATECKTHQLYTYVAAVERVVDADTLIVMVDTGFGVHHREILRLRLIDAPERRTLNGRRAKTWVEDALKPCSFVVIKTYKTDKYARYLADVFYLPNEDDPHRVAEQGEYLNGMLVAKGLAQCWQK